MAEALAAKEADMSDEFDQYQGEEPAAAPVQDPSSPFANDDEPAPQAPPPLPSTGRNLLILAGIAVIVIGAGLLVVLGPTFTLNKPKPQPNEPEQLRVRRVLTKWDGMDSADRQAAIPALVGSLKLNDEDLRLAVMLTLTNAGKDPVPELVKALRDDDFNVRIYAAWTLGRIGPDAADAVPALLEARNDPDGDVRRRAVYALGRIHPRAEVAVPVLLEAFKDKDVDVRRVAVEALAGYGKDAVPPLIKALHDPDRVVRRQAVLTLIEIGPDAGPALFALKPLYLDPASGLQDEAAKALSRLGKPAVPILAEPLKTDPTAPPGQVVLGLGSPWGLLGVWRDYAGDHRRALNALGQIGLDALDVLLAALKNPNADIRALAAGELGGIGYHDQRIVSPLVAAVRDPEESVRHAACRSIQQLGMDLHYVLPGLHAALQDPSPAVRLNVIVFLGELGAPAAPLLVEALKDKDPKICDKAVEALFGMQADNDYLLATVLHLLKDKSGTVRTNAVYVVRRCGLKAVPHLIDLLTDEEVAVRRAASEGLLAIPADEKVLEPGFVLAFADTDAAVRATATAGLGRIGFRFLEQLRLAQKDKDAKVRVKAVEGIARLNPNFREVFPALVESLKDDDRDVRLVAVGALSRFGPQAVAHLIEALNDKDDKVWQRAKESLKVIEVPKDAIFPPLVKALDDKSSSVRQGACLAMFRFKEDAVYYLVKALKDPDMAVQFMAADSLDDIGPPASKAIPALVDTATSTPHAKVRGRALMALVTIQGFEDYKRNPARAIPGLIERLEDPDGQIRMGAVQTLGAFGSAARDAVPPLSKLLNDSELGAAVRLAINRIQAK